MDSRLALLISRSAAILIEVASEPGQTCRSSKHVWAHVWVCGKSWRCGEGHVDLDTRLLQRDCAESLEGPMPA